MNNNSAIKLVALVFIAVPQLVRSICAGSQFWNPLNNACVDCNISINSRMSMALPSSILCRFIHQYLCQGMPHQP